jgi:hypothetical protein
MAANRRRSSVRSVAAALLIALVVMSSVLSTYAGIYYLAKLFRNNSD